MSTMQERRRIVHQVREEGKLEKNIHRLWSSNKTIQKRKHVQNRIHKTGQSCFNKRIVFCKGYCRYEENN